MTSRGNRAGHEMQRLTAAEMLEYWRLHDRRFGDIDYGRDPEGLSNICTPGQPIWLGRYYGRFQRLVYERLLGLTPEPEPDSRALDVGCGAARWCVLLADRGYRVTGIDLQPTLVADNRRRFPEIEFVQGLLQEFASAEPFDLVSSVTVLQHLPFTEQARAVARLRALTAPGGHAIVLENVRHQTPNHFSHTVAGWRSLFENAGFRTLTAETYNFSLALRLLGRFRAFLPASEQGAETDATVDSIVTRQRDGELRRSPFRAFLGLGHRSLLRLAVTVDSRVEPLLVGRRPLFAPTNCGFLFQAL